MALMLEKRDFYRCPLLDTKFPFYHVLDPRLRFRPSLITVEEPANVEVKAMLGRQIVSNLPLHFRMDNKGRFVAVTFTGNILAVCDTLEDLNKELVRKDIKENYYIERIGYSAIAQI